MLCWWLARLPLHAAALACWLTCESDGEAAIFRRLPPSSSATCRSLDSSSMRSTARSRSAMLRASRSAARRRLTCNGERCTKITEWKVRRVGMAGGWVGRPVRYSSWLCRLDVQPQAQMACLDFFYKVHRLAGCPAMPRAGGLSCSQPRGPWVWAAHLVQPELQLLLPSHSCRVASLALRGGRGVPAGR